MIHLHCWHDINCVKITKIKCHRNHDVRTVGAYKRITQECCKCDKRRKIRTWLWDSGNFKLYLLYIYCLFAGRISHANEINEEVNE